MTTSIRVRARLIGATAALMAWAVPSACAYAQTAAGRGEIPATVAAALSDVRIPTSAIGIVVAPLDGGPIQLAANESRPMNPASTMKLLTTYAALNLLGPTFQWRTEVYATSRPHGGRLDGDLILREALVEIVNHKDDLYNLIRWKEIYEMLEETTDTMEDVADVLQRVVIKNG